MDTEHQENDTIFESEPNDFIWMADDIQLDKYVYSTIFSNYNDRVDFIAPGEYIYTTHLYNSLIEEKDENIGLGKGRNRHLTGRNTCGMFFTAQN